MSQKTSQLVLLIVGVTLLAGSRLLRKEPPVACSALQPTPDWVIEHLTALGGRYKLNNFEQPVLTVMLKLDNGIKLSAVQ